MSSSPRSTTSLGRADLSRLEPSQERLEAVVNIKQHAGYNGDACSQGSHEYVRFFVERNGACRLAAWPSRSTICHAPAATEFTAWPRISTRRASSATPRTLSMSAHSVLESRAPRRRPNFTPPFRNVLSTRGSRWLPFAPRGSYRALLAEAPSPSTRGAGGVDRPRSSPARSLKPLSYAELKTLYASANVPGHRFGLPRRDADQNRARTLTPAKTAR